MVVSLYANDPVFYNSSIMVWKATIKIVGAAVILTLIGGVLFTGELNGDVEMYNRLSAEYLNIREGNSEIREARNRLKTECEALQNDDPRMLEKTLREDFGYVRNNEFVVRFTD